MRLHRRTWVALGWLFAALLVANAWCWQPGIGGNGPPRPPGTEVELFYGWPATSRASGPSGCCASGSATGWFGPGSSGDRSERRGVSPPDYVAPAG